MGFVLSDEISMVESSRKFSYKEIQMEQQTGTFAVKKGLAQMLKGGVIMDGRDIGTVVFPDAELKIFMTASPEIVSGSTVCSGNCMREMPFGVST